MILETIITTLISFAIGWLISRALTNSQITELRQSISNMERQINKLQDTIEIRDKFFFQLKEQMDEIECKLHELKRHADYIQQDIENE